MEYDPTFPRDPVGLSERQRMLLKLVAEGVTTSKALARETGLQPSSIDTYLHAAAKVLGCDGRLSAARRLSELDAKSSQPASQLRAGWLARRLKTAVLGGVAGMKRFFTGMPVGGTPHAYSWTDVALQILRVAIIGVACVTAVSLTLIGFLRAMGNVHL